VSFLAAAKAIKATTRTSTEKLVLIIISDCISDETGIAWPSIDYISEHAMCSPRTARRSIRSLEDQGLITTEVKSGRSNVYSISEPINGTDPSQIGTPAKLTEGADTRGRGGGHPCPGGRTRESLQATPALTKSAEPINNLSITNKGTSKDLPEYVDQEAWNDFMDVRKKLKAVHSDRAINTLINKIEKYHNQGLDVNEILEASIVSSWKDIYPRKEDQNGKGQSGNSKNPTAKELLTNYNW